MQGTGRVGQKTADREELPEAESSSGQELPEVRP